MNTEELLHYIKHYFKNDQTHLALMLSGEWGTGKSYFIQNILLPELNKESRQTISISLYGLDSLYEVSKSLYMELRLKALTKKSEKFSAGKLFAKTIVKGIAGYFGVDLNISEDNLRQLYDSVDLRGKLIILEDVERTSINILELMGFVNNLVEQDGVKVLLVVNETELIRYEEPKYKSKSEKKINEIVNLTSNEERPYTLETEEYLRIKEKTVGDTIIFNCDLSKAIKSILNDFKGTRLSKFQNSACLKEIEQIVNEQSNNNLRIFIFACQKTADILQYVSCADIEFLKAIFYSNIYFAYQLKTAQLQNWTESGVVSGGFGSIRYPLFNFCYQYIVNHRILESDIMKAEKDFKEFKLYDDGAYFADDDLNIIYSYYTRTEREVKIALNNIIKRLKNNKDLPYNQYGSIANYLVSINETLGYDISEAKSYLINNIRGLGDKILGYTLFSSGIEINNSIKKQEFINLQNEMLAALEDKQSKILSLTTIDAEKFCEEVNKSVNKFITKRAFASKLDLNKFISMLKDCTAKQIKNLRSAFTYVYSAANIKESLANDKKAIDLLRGKIYKLLNSYEGFDDIQKLQIKYFANNLHEISVKLS